MSDLYKKLDSLLPPSGENICMDCYKCCTAAARQKVSSVELDYIKDYLRAKDMSLSLMKDYNDFLRARLKSDSSDAWQIICPFYNVKEKRCIIYPVRPYSCRIYGNYSGAVEDLPGNCPYRKKVNLYTEKNMFKVIPCSVSYGSIAAAYNTYKKYTGWFAGF